MQQIENPKTIIRKIIFLNNILIILLIIILKPNNKQIANLTMNDQIKKFLQFFLRRNTTKK